MRAILPLLALLLAACGDGTEFFAPPPARSELRVNVTAETVMVNAVSMPEYAVNQEIPIQRADGSLVTDTDKLWADLPDRALQVSLARHLNMITDAEVGVEPWPLAGFPEREVTVTVEDMIVQASGTLRFTGFYAIRDEVARSGQIETFALTAPVAGDGYPAIIAAHEAVWLQLAEIVARAL
ncbi:membrane integrity-associated transporter subunit PqiC [Jannaschia sp. W003]|uniref:PqiC family protein n=1 Tax=Jannaschia sp. W003 TaxID=2867012 RepID=UPI0021A2EFB0|nr:PqiC family protein [Jannaschia sp. W003]UWQ22448.1 PqiC family protein [Jannaschia sp. W003]